MHSVGDFGIISSHLEQQQIGFFRMALIYSSPPTDPFPSDTIQNPPFVDTAMPSGSIFTVIHICVDNGTTNIDTIADIASVLVLRCDHAPNEYYTSYRCSYIQHLSGVSLDVYKYILLNMIHKKPRQSFETIGSSLKMYLKNKNYRF